MATWTGQGTQADFMMKDMCILVDERDRVLDSVASKRECHQFTQATPSGALHRAFSVFLFNSKNELLIQQRASSKVTFPDVWTNTCCSHQLHSQVPSEVDEEAATRRGDVPGAAAAALRKLKHELGIEPSTLRGSNFKFLTRLHYCAADADAAGAPTGWGEHEMDYILFVRADVALAPEPDEVRDTKYVGPLELKAMMQPSSGLKWSPWFRIIADNFLHAWWHDLDDVLASTKHADWQSIHKLSC